MSDAKRSQPSTPDLETLDAGWEDEDDEDDDEEEEVGALDAGWDSPKRRKTAAERAARRKEQARRKAEKRRARVAELAQKQKQKKRRAKDDGDDGDSVTGANLARATDDDGAEVDRADISASTAPRAKKQPPPAKPARSLRRDWARMGVIVAIIVLVAGAAFYLLGKR